MPAADRAALAMTIAPWGEAAVVALLLAPAAVIDLRELRIPDWTVLGVVLLGVAKRVVIGPPLS